MPSTIAFGEKFKIKVGVKCSLGCQLMGKPIEIYNHEGTKIATGTVGDVPWSNEAALSCTEVELKAPGEEETRYRWTAKFPAPGLELPHAEASSAFAFGTASKADHIVTVEVIDSQTKAAIKDAHVVLRPAIYRGNAYMGRSDEGGVARVGVPKNKYHISVTKDEYKTFMWIAEVASDTVVKVELIAGSDLEEFIG